MQSRKFALSLLALSLLAGATLPVQAEVLKGSATMSTTKTPSLNRGDIKPNNNDPFSGTDDDGELLEVPKNVRQEPVRAPIVKKPFNLNAQQQGNPYNPQHAAPVQAPVEMGGEGDPMPAAAQQPAMPPPPAFNPNDPDTSPDMQLAWDLWHKRVAQSIFERFNFFAKAAFRNSPPLMAKLTYTVTRDGHIMNLNMPQKANNVLFNVLVHQSVKSLEGDMSILAFPEGSRRMWVPKSGTFTQNYGGGEGFRYTVGDRETVQGGGRR
jgi:hypothetical protein